MDFRIFINNSLTMLWTLTWLQKFRNIMENSSHSSMGDFKGVVKNVDTVKKDKT